jgi:hypothetical protein
LSISFQLTFLPYCPYHFTIFFCIFHIISHFNLLFFHIFHIISQFSSVFSISFHYSSHVSSIIFIFFLIISFYSLHFKRCGLKKYGKKVWGKWNVL